MGEVRDRFSTAMDMFLANPSLLIFDEDACANMDNTEQRGEDSAEESTQETTQEFTPKSTRASVQELIPESIPEDADFSLTIGQAVILLAVLVAVFW